MIDTYLNKKPHLVDGERILRQYDRRPKRCQVLYPLGNDSANIYILVQNCTNTIPKR